jgi:peptide/nickel transport system permease protein
VRWRRALAALREPFVLLSALWLLLILAAALLPHIVWPGDPFTINMSARLAAPSLEHPFGTDEYGRDLLARVVLGTRYSLGTAVGMVLAACVIGMVVGAASAWIGGWVDFVVMRLVELFMSFPAMILAIALVSVLGASLTNAALAILLIWWGQYARMMRSEVLRARSELYVEGALALGSRSARVLLKHIVPNTFYPVAVKATIDVGVAILLIGGLSFIGLAAQPPLPEWGLLISAGRRYLLSYWWYAVMPGAVMFLTVVSLNIFSDSVLGRFDPRSRQ